MKTETFDKYQLDALKRALGSLQSMVLRLDEVDFSRGRGVLEGKSRCMWTQDGCRITITPTEDGGLVGSCARKPDPELVKI